jgi:hypothetical protein
MQIITRLLLFCATIVAPFLVKSQIVYTDLVPDSQMYKCATSYYKYIPIDLNKDSIFDIRVALSQGDHSIYVSVIPVNNAAIIKSKLNINAAIGDFSSWATTSYLIASGYWNQSYFVFNKFFGVKINKNGQSYYGWIRLDYINDFGCSKITIRDFAYNSTPNQPILAGSNLMPKSEKVIVEDIADNHTGKDMQIKFEKALSENLLSEYRIFVVKESDTSNFSLNIAENADSGRYEAFVPTGLPTASTNLYTHIMKLKAKDISGDYLVETVPYYVYVLSVSSNIETTPNVLSDKSNRIVLTTPTLSVSNLSASKNYLGGTSYKINLSFDKVPNEADISSYQAIFFKSSGTSSLSLNAANDVPNNARYSIIPDGSNPMISFLSDTLLDNTGQPLSKDYSYKAYILTVANGTTTNSNALSEPSQSLVLKTYAQRVTNFYIEDVSDNGNTSDLRIVFDKITLDSCISGYRIIAVKLADVSTFNLSEAESVLPQNSFFIPRTGDNIDTLMPANAKDKDGDFIMPDQLYRFFIFTQADSIHTDCNALSKYSSIVTTHIPSYFATGIKDGENVFYTNIDPDTVFCAYNGGVGNYYLDLNNDGVNDFLIHKDYDYSSNVSGGNTYIDPLNNNSVAVISQGSTHPDTLRYKSMLSNDIYWNDEKCTLYYYSSYVQQPSLNQNIGIWRKVTNKYLGLRVLTSNEAIFGWILLDNQYNSIKLKEYAYYSDSVLMLSEKEESFFELYPNPASETIGLRFSNQNIKSATIEIINCNGHQVFNNEISPGSNTLDITHLQPGIFVVKIFNDELCHYKKLVITNK